MANDSEILALIYDRNEQGLEMLQSEYGAYCMTIAMNILGSTEDAEECVNDAIFAVWKNTTQVRPQNLKIYIGRIVRNIAITRYRANNSQKRGGEYASAVCELGEVCYGSFEKGNYTELHKMSGSVPSPEEEVLFSELENAILAFLETVSIRDRRVFLARYYYFYSTDEISRRLGHSRNHVLMILSRLRKKLNRFLKELELI